MDFSVFVPLTHLFLAMLAAFSLPNEVKNCKMDWEGYTTAITKTVAGDATIVSFTAEGDTTRYTFRGTHVTLSDIVEGPDGKNHEATGSYDLKKEFGIADPKQLAKAAETILRGDGKTVTMRLEHGEHELFVTEASGDSPGVFRYPDKKFPPAKFKWK